MERSTGSSGEMQAQASGPAVRVPGILIHFLERATVAVAGTRDAQRIPHMHRVSAWRLGADQQTMTCCVAAAFEPHLLESLQDNGWFTVTIEEIGPHETYQFKGRYLDWRPCNDEDLEAHRRLVERFTRVVASLYGISEAACRAHVHEPRIAIRFEILEIYLQTPGPGAGRRLVPPEASP